MESARCDGLLEREVRTPLRLALVQATANPTRPPLARCGDSGPFEEAARTNAELIQYPTRSDSATFLPLSPHMRMPITTASEALTVPASKRPYLFNLVASANTHPSRRAWLDTAVGWLSTRCAFVFEAKEWMPHEQRGDRFASTFWQCRGRGRGVEGPVGISTVSANPMSYSEYRKVLLRALAHAHP